MQLTGLPLFFRKFIVDFIEGTVAFTLSLALVFPMSVLTAQQEAVAVAGGVAAAFVASVRRNAPDALLALRQALGVPPASPSDQ